MEVPLSIDGLTFCGPNTREKVRVTSFRGGWCVHGTVRVYMLCAWYGGRVDAVCMLCVTVVFAEMVERYIVHQCL